MQSKVKTKKLRIGGMTCVSCQNKIEKKLRNTVGVKSVKVSYNEGTADISYDINIISFRTITAIIKKLDYQVLTGKEKAEADISRVIGILIIIVSLYVLLQQFGLLNILVPSQLADAKMGYGMLFVIGLITSIHCIAMCGGINLSQCIPSGDTQSRGSGSQIFTFAPAFLYNFGRVISYTVVGFVLGFVGMLFGGGLEAGLPVMVQGIFKFIAGAFMVIMGINMLGIFPWMRKLNPRIPKILARKIGHEKHKSKNPLVVGLLNGLMPCGPLQSMQIVALASGNPFAGALSMFLFSLGTVPLMLGLGSIVSALGKKFTQKVMNVGAVLVVVLGLAMLSQGGSLSGLLPPDYLLFVILTLCALGIMTSIPFRKPSYKVISTVATLGVAFVVIASWNAWAVGSTSTDDNGIQIIDGKQVVSSTLSSSRYPNIAVQMGVPVRWIIDAPQGSINGCNNRMFINDYDIEYSFNTGENIIEFTPTKTGNIQYSCWMGMIRGTITVTEEGAEIPAEANTDDSYSDDYAVNDFYAIPESTPAGYVIPTNEVVIAEEIEDDNEGPVQTISIQLTDKGFSPALIIVQAGKQTLWNITENTSAETGSQLLVPNYATQLSLEKGENQLFLFPTESFDFSTGDNTFYGYVKVVDDIDNIDVEAIKEEVSELETLIWSTEAFQGGGAGADGASCH